MFSLMYRYKYWFLITTLCCTGPVLNARTVHTVCNGYWSDSTIWDLGVPLSTDIVVLDHYVKMDQAVIVNRLDISSTGRLCGTYSFTGRFITYGPMWVGSMHITGSSVNYSSIITLGSIIGTSGTWTAHAPVIVGGTFTCDEPVPCFSPTASFSTNSPGVCVNQNITLTNTSVYPTTYNWAFPGANIPSSTLKNPTIHYTSPGIYPITLICSNAYGADTTTHSIIVYPSPVISLMNDTSTCKNIPVTLSASGMGNILWSPSANLSCNTCFNPVFNGAAGQDYIVTLTDGNNCQAKDTIRIEVLNPPNTDLKPAYFICGDDSSVTIHIADAAGNSFLWSTGATGSHITLYSPQTVTVVATGANTCIAYDTLNISEADRPLVKIQDDTTLCSYLTVELKNILPNGSLTYLWSTGETSPAIAVNETGMFTLTVTNEYACTNSDTTYITFTDCDVITPNILTPNGDGINDVLRFDDLPPLSGLHIYNRWGKLIYTDSNYKNDWQAENISDGVYYYTLSLPQQKGKGGTIQITR